jgi:hypothetical protein
MPAPHSTPGAPALAGGRQAALPASGKREGPADPRINTGEEGQGQDAASWASADRRAIAAFLGAVLAVKLAVLLGVGPVVWPDSAGYLAFADAILTHGLAFRPIAWAHGPAAPDLVFRLVGYPLVLAVAKLISPIHYGQITVFIQILLNMFTVSLMALVLEQLAFTTTQIILALGLYLFSDSLLLDNSLLSDSTYASLFNIVLFFLLGCLAGRWRWTATGAAGLGFVWGFSTWTRDSGIFFTYLPIVLLLALAGGVPGGARHRFAGVLAFAVIVLGMTGAYAGFNKYRTGEFFFSITGVENWLRPVFDMAQYREADPFVGNDLVSRTVREGMPDYRYQAQLAFIERLNQRCECTPTRLQSIVFDKYLSTVRQYPIAYLREVWQNFHYFGLVGLIADPVATINQFFDFGTPLHHDVAPGLSIRNLRQLRQRFSAGALALMLLNGLSTAVATVLFSLFLFGVPCLVLRARRRGGLPLPLAVVGFLWFSFASVSLVFSLVHYEARHALPILPAGCIGAIYALFEVRRLVGRRALGQPSA